MSDYQPRGAKKVPKFGQNWVSDFLKNYLGPEKVSFAEWDQRLVFMQQIRALALKTSEI